ncbi:MAG: tRNA 2-thiouridine(34) synthase MnmA [Alphaproteobacteria bacterium]
MLLTTPLLPGKKPADTKLVVAMSGGVDSSVVAGLLAEAGYDVVGITLQLYDHGVAVGKKGACCAGQDIYDAKRVCETLGITHYVLDYEQRFRAAVIEDFADSYANGETPVPCVRCNQKVKFRDMLETALELGVDAMATGHYVQRLEGSEGAELHRAVDSARDQSYFLFTTTRPQLEKLCFPLGGFPDKQATRELASRYGLSVAEKPDSQDICFVPTGKYSDIVTKISGVEAPKGEIVHVDGRVLGEHLGLTRYTVGQRKGLGISAAEPLFVIALDKANNRLVVGPYAALGRSTVYLRELNWLGSEGVTSMDVMVKLRSAQPAMPAHVTRNDDGTAIVHLHQPYFGVAPGQACVFYQESRVLGGGWISSAT